MAVDLATIHSNLTLLAGERTDVVQLYHRACKIPKEIPRGAGQQVHCGHIGALRAEQRLVRVQQPFSLLQILIVRIIEQVGSGLVEVVENGDVAVLGAILPELLQERLVDVRLGCRI